MTRTILNGLAVAALTLTTSTSAQACLVTGQRVAEFGFDRVFPREASSALRKEAELRGRQFLVSTQRTDHLSRPRFVAPPGATRPGHSKGRAT